MNFKGTPLLETSRLILRKFRLEDAEFMFKNWTSSKEVSKYLTWDPHKSAKDSELYLIDLVEEYKNPQVLNWCIHFKECNQPVGCIDARLISESLQSFDIGYCLGEKWWNKGIMTERQIQINYAEN